MRGQTFNLYHYIDYSGITSKVSTRPFVSLIFGDRSKNFLMILFPPLIFFCCQLRLSSE